MAIYSVDLGDRCVVWSEKKLRKYYAKEIEHNPAMCGYPSYEDWLTDMWRMRLVVCIGERR